MASLDKILEDDENGQAHDFLIEDCPWYRHVSDEKNCGDPAAHCQHDEADSGVKLTPETPEASTVVKPTVKPGGPGLFHVKGMHLPPYMEHLWFHLVKRYGKHDAYRVANGIVHKWAAGINPGGFKTKSGKGKRVHADVQAAAQKNIAEWEKDRAEAHAQSASHVAATMALSGAMNMGTVTQKGQQGFQAASSMAGKYSQYGLHQHPSQTVSPSPPLPPDVPLPSPKEVRDLIKSVPECSEVSLSNSVKTFLETAAVKLEKNDEQQALAMLRSAQAALYSAHKQDLGPYMAAIWGGPGTLSTTDSRVIPAGQSSATPQMRQSRETQIAWHGLSVSVAALIARLRQRYFHGHINGVLPNLRMTEETAMTTLDKVLALAGAPITTGKDVSFPTESDTSRETRLLQGTDNLTLSDFKAQKELASLPPLSRLAIETHLDGARDALRQKHVARATECLGKACAVAHTNLAHHLLKELHRHKEAVLLGENHQHTPAEMEYRPLHQSSPQTVADTGNRPAAKLR